VAVEGRRRPAWAEVDLAAITHNTAVLASVMGRTPLCAVVKADGYGHGALAVAKPMLEAGAGLLGVALVDEGIELRESGIAAPILVLAEAPGPALEDALASGLTLTVGSVRGAYEVSTASAVLGGEHVVHVKIDTGMHRMGALQKDLGEVLTVLAEGGVKVGGIWTHFSVADGAGDEDKAFTREQLALFDDAVASVSTLLDHGCLQHAANTAGALSQPAARRDFVRIGLGLYGYLPAPELAAVLHRSGVPALRPVLSVKARVSAIHDVAPGARPSYGRLREMPDGGRVATVPFGYADGYPRAMFEGGAVVLIRGRRRPLAGMVTMDQLVIDCSPDDDVTVGDEVVLLGRQGTQVITADDWAAAIGTSSWEVLCGLKPRVPKLSVD
jgi:alanine racemase